MPAVFVWVPAIPSSPNGKTDRAALPAPDPHRGTSDSSYEPPQNPIQENLAAVWAETLGLERVGVTDNFFELGGDSILSIQVVSRARRLGIDLTAEQLFTHQTIAELAFHTGQRQDAVDADQQPVVGPVPLTPIQRAFVDRGFPQRDHYNQSRWLEVRSPLDPGVLRRALDAILEHHDALRLTLTGDGESVAQRIGPPGRRDVLTVVDLTGAVDQDARREHAAQAAHTGLSLAEGPLLRAVLFTEDDHGHQSLFLVVHHLAVDEVSWRILIEDLETACGQLERGEPVTLPAKTTSFKRWAERLTELATEIDSGGPAELTAELEHWLSNPDGAPLPRDHDAVNDLADARVLLRTLDPDQTHRLLYAVPGAYGTQVNDALLTPLARAVGEWAGAAAVTVDLEGHGRENLGRQLDVSRTVGWFTTLHPVSLPTTGLDPGVALKTVKERLRAVPRHGIGHGVLRRLATGEVGRAVRSLPPAEIAMNYLGRADRVTTDTGRLRPRSHSLGAERAPAGPREHLIDLDCRVVDGCLELKWTFSTRIHEPATIERLARRYEVLLHELIDHCADPDISGYTPSDFPLADLDQSALDLIQRRLDGTTTSGERA